MNTNFEYNRFHAQSKIRELQQEGILNQQLKQLEKPKNAPISINQIHRMLLILKSKLVRPVYIFRPQ